jgi:hypothetical protein
MSDDLTRNDRTPTDQAHELAGSAGEDDASQRPARRDASVKLAAVLFGLAAVYFMTGQRATSRMETACASVLNVVHPEGSTFERHGSDSNGSDRVVRLLYAVKLPDGATKQVIILCAFDDHAITAQLPPLVAVALNGHQLGPARLSFLNRFWLHSVEAQADLPATAAAREATKR